MHCMYQTCSCKLYSVHVQYMHYMQSNGANYQWFEKDYVNLASVASAKISTN